MGARAEVARRGVRWVALAAGAALLASGTTAGPALAGSRSGAADVPPAVASDYVNPVSREFADTFADPAVIRGKDGWWYAYGTTDPLVEGEGERHLLPVSRSRDLVSWEYVGDAFTEDTIPDWADTSVGAALWAPDIRYVDGQYRLYYVVTETTVTGERFDNAIGVATSASPTGPWTDSGGPVVGPVDPDGPDGADNFLWTFDPHHVSAQDGTEYLFYGSYYGGIFVTELDETGTRAVGEPTMVTIDNKYEGAYVVRRDGWWYLFVSSANCCAGPTTGYSVHVGRSRNLTGPYVDREGVPLNQSRAGGTPVIAPNGNAWVGTGHNAVVTDLAGQDWFVYHAIDRADPYLDEPFGVNERPMLIDRLDWIDGWPTVRAGAWASDDEQTGPVTGGRAVTDFADGIEDPFVTYGPGWSVASDDDAGRHARSAAGGTSVLVTRSAPAGNVRVEADLRQNRPGTAGLVAGLNGRGDRVGAYVRAGRGEFVLEVVRVGAVVERTVSDLPADHDRTAWHSIVLEVGDGRAYAELSDARLGDPHAVAELALPAGAEPSRTAGAQGGPVTDVDNLSVVPLAEPVTELAPRPEPGELDEQASVEFDGDDLGPGWTQLRDPQVEVVDGELRWQVEQADLVGTGNNAGLLLRDPPAGDWTAETKVTIDLGTDTVRNFQQAGILAHVDDDRFARLSHVAIFNTRQTEFGKEMPFADALAFGGTILGPPADTTWLRLLSRTDPDNGEREIQAATSTDGRTWIYGGVWTLPAGSDIRVGLLAHGAQTPEDLATARFDFLRFYQD